MSGVVMPKNIAIMFLCSVLSGCALSDLFGSHKTESPSTIWHVGGRAVGAAAYDGSRVYAVMDSHTVTAFDARNGERVWSTKVNGGPGIATGFSGCQLADDVVVCVDSTLIGLRRSDGVVLWRYVPAIKNLPGYSDFVIKGNIAFASSPAGVVYGIDIKTGSELWAHGAARNGTVITNTLGIAADSGIVTAAFTRFTNPETGGVIALNPSNGAVLWTFDFPQVSTDTLSGGVSTTIWKNLVLASSADGRIYALSRATGMVQWTTKGAGTNGFVGGPFGADFRFLSIDQDVLYSSSSSAWFIAYDLNDGHEKWRVATRGSQTERPVSDGGTLYEILSNGHLAAVSKDGKLIWDIGADFDFSFPPTMDGDRMFVTGPHGIWAFAR
jgi:outer membrane protein assembly factor BamB